MLPNDTEVTQPSELRPPSCSDMLVLDREKFELIVKCRAMEVPVKQCTELMKLLKSSSSRFSHLQKKPRLVLPCEEDSTRKLILLDDNQNPPLNSDSIVQKEINIKLTYKNWSASQILRAILPDSMDDTKVISGFEIVGHIAHLNLKEYHLPYKSVIGQVILDKNPSIKTVVNKLHSIHSQYRYFDMEVIAGEDSFITTASEHKIKYNMDFSKLYWNSRLSSEHKRVVDSIPSGSTVLDIFCGIGPFALPLARKQCFVHANDLNPESYKYLLENIEINKISSQYITCYNLDGRELIKNFVGKFDFVLMNLPASATEFLDVFKGLYSRGHDSSKPPTVFCYHFADIEGPEESSTKAVSEKLGCSILPEEVHLVRKTAPKTWMTCVKFVVPTSVLYLYGENGIKRIKLDKTES